MSEMSSDYQPEQIELRAPRARELSHGPQVFTWSDAPTPVAEWEPVVSLREYFAAVWSKAPIILGVMAACGLLAFVVSKKLTPSYESTSFLQLDRGAQLSTVGQQDAAGKDVGFEDFEQFLTTQIRLIQSDPVLRPVAEKYKLLQREGQLGTDSAKNQHVMAAPVLLRRLTVKRVPDSALISIAYRSNDAQLSADVANGIAASFIEYAYDVRVRASAQLASLMDRHLVDLRQQMDRSSGALANFERELNIADPEEKTNILSNRLVQLNGEYTAAQGERVRKEAIYRAAQSNVTQAAQIAGQGEMLTKVQGELNAAREHFATVKVEYGPKHPEYKKAASEVSELESQFAEARSGVSDRLKLDYVQAQDREAMLAKQVAGLKAEFDSLNGRSFQYRRLREDAEADRKLYEEVNNKIKAGVINAGFENNSIRIAEAALPAAKPVFPNTVLNMLVAMFVSGLGTASYFLLRDRLDTTLRSPDEARHYLGTNVIATLPHLAGVRPPSALLSDPQSADTNDTGGGRKRPRSGYRMLSPYEEGIRTLRNSILLLGQSRNLKSVLITSPRPGDGKTTAAVHLSVALSKQGNRTLLINCDLRRSCGLTDGEYAGPGLSNVLAGECGWRGALQRSDDRPMLDVLPAGEPSQFAADLIGPGIQRIVRDAGHDYDVVIVDGPPFHGFAETLQIASAVDAVAVVGSVGETERHDMRDILDTLHRTGTAVLGIVLNRSREAGRSYVYSSRAGGSGGFFSPRARRLS